MKHNKLQRVYDATNAGLDIIRQLLPEVDDGVINHKKPFRLRPEEHTPSARLYPPKDADDCWHVKDYGNIEGGGYFSPIDIYMWEYGYGQNKFSLAVEELAEQYGVQEVLTAGTNKPDLEYRAARQEELGAGPRVKLFEGLGGIDLSCWGDGVKAEHLATYGWMAVSEVSIKYGDKVMVRKPTPTYPIFAQSCTYIDQQGQQQVFYKVYEPKNPDKGHRFLISGKKPQNYIYGLDAVRRKYEEQGEEKLSVLLLVSGGSDAVCALSKGYMAVWLDSEVKGLSMSDYALLKKHAHCVVNIPDIDSTGIKAGRLLALNIPDIHTAWLTSADMGGLHDNRGRLCKDLRDYCRLHPSKQAMDQLVGRAVSAQFWTEHQNKQGAKEYTLSLTSLNYFLELNGYYTLKDDSRREPVYIHIDGIVVEHVTAKAIVGFLRTWMEQQGLPSALQDKVLRSRDLPTVNISTLHERDDMDFRKSTDKAEYFHFRNCWVEVTGEKILTHRYSEPADHYVWRENIIEHDYKPLPDMFAAGKDEEGRWVVSFTEQAAQCKLMKFFVNSARLYWRKTDEAGEALTTEEQAEEHLLLSSRLANMGYLLCSSKSEAEAWATICQDSTLAENADECNGRSGKSFYLKAAAKMVSTFTINASTTNFKDTRFLFDGVTTDTSMVFIDECPQKFNYNFIYGMVTDDFRVEEKNRHSFVIPFAESPKFALATNFTLSRHDPSTEGRIWPQPFSDYYHVKTPKNDYRETRSIRDDFGQILMGKDYSEQDWQQDLACMLQCVRFYKSLEPGQRRIMPPMNRIERREQLAAVGKDFKQWADDYFAEGSGNLDCKLKADVVLADFNQETKFGWSLRSMWQHLTEYCQLAEHIRCLNPVSITHKKKDGDPWIDRDENRLQKRYYYVQSVKAFAEAEKPEPLQTDLAFGTQQEDADSDEPF